MGGTVYVVNAFASDDRLSTIVPEGARWFYCGSNTVNFHRILRAFGPGRPQAAVSRDFSAFVDSVRPTFVAEFEKINAAFGESLDYWVDDLFSKNPHQNSLFINYCYLQFIDRLFLAGDAAPLALVFENEKLAPLAAAKARAADASCEDHSHERDLPSAGIRGVFGKFLSFAKFVATSLVKWMLARFVYRAAQKGPAQWDILFETYMIESDFNAAGGWRDRYFPGLADYARARGYATAVAPVFPSVGIGGYGAILRLCRAHPANGIVVMEDWLCFSDYLHALFYLLRRISRRRIGGSIGQADIRDLALLEWGETLFSTMSFLALLRYRFVKRLRQAGVGAKRVIMWYENQTLQKAFAWGMREQFPGAVIVGAQMFVPPVNHLNLYVTAGECRAPFVPDVLLVPGAAYLGCFAQFAPRERYGVAASMRYGHLFAHPGTDSPQDENSVVAVLLPQSLGTSLSLLRLLFGAVKGAEAPPILIRAHPTVPPEMVRRYMRDVGVDIPGELFTGEDLSSLLLRTAVVVSSESGTVVESMCMGKPVIEVASTPGLDFSVHIPSEAGMFHRKVFTENEAKSALFDWALGSFRSIPLPERHAATRIILEKCFTPNDPAWMQVLLGNPHEGAKAG